MIRSFVLVVTLGAVLTGCASTVPGTPGAAPGNPPTTTEVPPTTTTSASTPPATGVDEASVSDCGAITGWGGKEMLTGVETLPGGNAAKCEDAVSVLGQYYRQAPRGSQHLDISGWSCDQVPEPALPQVICQRAGLKIFSMWRQGG